MRCMKFRSVQSVSELTLKSKTLLSWAGGWVPSSIHVWQTRRLNSQEKLIASIQTTHRRFLKGFLNKLLRTLWHEIRRQQLYDRMNNLRLIFSTTPVLSKIRSDRDPGNHWFWMCSLHFSLFILSHGNGNTHGSIGFQDVSNSAYYMRKRLRARQKEMYESWGTTTKRNRWRGRTSLEAKCVSHILSSYLASPLIASHLSSPPLFFRNLIL